MYHRHAYEQNNLDHLPMQYPTENLGIFLIGWIIRVFIGMELDGKSTPLGLGFFHIIRFFHAILLTGIYTIVRVFMDI